MSILNMIKTGGEMKEYLESLTKHVLDSEKIIGALEARLNLLADTVACLEESVYED